MKTVLIQIVFWGSNLMLGMQQVHAQTVGGDGGDDVSPSVKLKNPINVSSIQEFIKEAVDLLHIIGVPIVAIFIIISGFKFVTARGNSEKLQEAKQTLLYTLIGAAVLLGAWVIAEAIGGTVDQLQDNNS